MKKRGHSTFLGKVECPLFCSLCAVVVLIVYLPCLDAEFVDWDDDKNFVGNRHYKGLGPSQLLWMLTTTHMGPYQPLSWLTLGVDYTLWGMNPRGYHLTNVLLHACGAAAMCLATASVLSIRRARQRGDNSVSLATETMAWPGASTGVLLAGVVASLAWALHPQHVESVAWVTERRDVLSGLFYLLCVWSYLQAHRGGVGDVTKRRWERAAVACCALALLSKASAVSLPVLLVVLDVYPLGRLSGRPWRWLREPNRHVLQEKFNYVLFSVLAAAVGFIGQMQADAVRSFDQVGPIERLAIAAHSFLFYLSKTIWPAELAPLYPRPNAIRLTDPKFLYPVISVLAISGVLLLLRRRWPAGLAIWACYVAALLPVCGLITIGDELVADRYAYLPTLALFVLLGGMFLWLWDTRLGGVRGVGRRLLAVGAAAAVVVACGWQARRIMPIWHDSLALWTHAAERRPESYKAWNNLAGPLTKDKRYAEAERACRKALNLRPDYATAHYNLGVALTRQGRQAEAAEAFRRAIQIQPTHAQAHANLGTVLIWLGQPEEAIKELNEALRLGYERRSSVHTQLGEAYLKLGQPEKAVQYYKMAILTPRHMGPLAGIADAYLRLGQIKKAEEAALLAFRARPDRPQGRYALAQVRSCQRRFGEAFSQLHRVLPKHPFFRQRALEDPHLRNLRLDPRFDELMRSLPTTLPATSGPAQGR